MGKHRKEPKETNRKIMKDITKGQNKGYMHRKHTKEIIETNKGNKRKKTTKKTNEQTN